MNSTQEYASETAPEIVSSRIFNISKKLLFEAYTNPAILATWWGSKGFTNTFHEFDLQSSGQWNFTMHGPDGVDYKNKIVFREIVPFEKLIFDHVSGPKYRGKVIFAEVDTAGDTQLTYTMIFELPKVYKKLREFIIAANEENFDRLEEVFGKIKEN